MKKWLCRYFIPHVDNAYRPHFLLRKNLLRFLAVVVGLELILFILPAFFFTTFIDQLNLAAIVPGTLSSLTNSERQSHGLDSLLRNPLLDQVATLKAEDMARNSYFAHTSPEGKSPWHWFKQVDYVYAYAGENLAVSFTDSEALARAWMNSPAHRANIIGKNYTEIGTGAATGRYKGRESFFVAQVYAKPLGTRQLVSAAPEAKIFEKILLSPQEGMKAVLYSSLALILAALLLNIFVKMDRQYPDLIRNGLLAAVLIAAIYAGNTIFLHSRFETSFLSFEQTEETFTQD